MIIFRFRVVIICTLFGTSEGIAVKRSYRRVLRSTQLTERLATYTGVSRLQCLSLCADHATCFYASFYRLGEECGLSENGTSLNSMVATYGWKLYQVDKDCPGSGDDFTKVGNHEIALCQGSVNHSIAQSSCARGGLGRLIEIKTETMFDEIITYLLSPPWRVRDDYYDDIWTAGFFDNETGTWKFPNGDLLPIRDGTEYGRIDGSSPCIQLNANLQYQWDDETCNAEASYLCEKV